jgi:hypothetical protein
VRGHIAHEGGWDTAIGRSSSIQPYSGILIGTPLACKSGLKNDIPGNVYHFLMYPIFRFADFFKTQFGNNR